MSRLDLPLLELATIIGERLPAGETRIVGITGSVASGKSTLAADLSGAFEKSRPVATVSTDGFLFPNDVLEPQGLIARKGFPETFDQDLLVRALDSVRHQPTDFPGYSHELYNIDPALSRRIEPGLLLLVEGLGLPPSRNPQAIDLLIYIDASEADLEHWYVARFLEFWRAAPDNPSSFYRRFLHLDEAGVTALARTVWTGVNLPNLREHISLARDAADFVVLKDRSHRWTLQRRLNA